MDRAERAKKIAFGPIYEVSEATYIIKAGSTIKDFATLDQAGVTVAAVNDTPTMRGAMAHLKHAKVVGFQTFDEIFNLLKDGKVDAFALSRDQLNALAKKIPGTRVLDERVKLGRRNHRAGVASCGHGHSRQLAARG